MGLAIFTERLRLEQLSVSDAVAMLEGERPPGQRWADGYPTERSLLAAGLLATADMGAYGTFLISRRADGAVIGDCGFHGPPDETGAVMIGFEIVPAQRGYGYGGEAVEALVAFARTLPGLVSVHAETEPSNSAARRVLERAGLTAIDGGRVVHFVG